MSSAYKKKYFFRILKTKSKRETNFGGCYVLKRFVFLFVLRYIMAESVLNEYVCVACGGLC